VTVQVKNLVRKKFLLESFLPPTFLDVFGMLDRRDVSISLFLIRLKRFVEVEPRILARLTFLILWHRLFPQGETNFVPRNNST